MKGIVITMNKILHLILNMIGKMSRTSFDYDIKEMKRYVRSFPEPQNDIDRSYYQYKCQMRLAGVFMTVCLNMAAFPILSLCLIMYKKSAPPLRERRSDAVFFRDGKPDNILPDEVRGDFDEVVINPVEGYYLDKSDRKFVLCLLREHLFSFFYVLKIMLKVSRYRYVMNQYNPVAIIVCNEYSFTSSALTKFCNENEIEHINVMHGEKCYDMRDTFFRYNRCYVWDMYYKNLFIKLRADENQFIKSVPRSLLFNEMQVAKTHDYTYYLGDEDNKTLDVIAEKLELLSINNKVLVRPHPRYSRIKQVEKSFKNVEIEEYGKVSIEESILGTKYAISLCSTALEQARCNGTFVIIDDVSNKEKYEKLSEMGYIGLTKPHLLFSKVLQDNLQS